MSSSRNHLLMLLALVVFSANGAACGQVEVPMTLVMDSDASSIALTLEPVGIPLGESFFEGGLSTLMTLDIGLLELLFHLPFSGVIEITDLLFGSTSIAILGTPTGTLCTTVDGANPGGGTVLVDIFDGEIAFTMALGTLILPTNPAILALLPDGFSFEFMFSDTTELSLLDLLALAFGNASGGLTLSQAFSDVIEVEILGSPLMIGVDGTIVMTTANEVPTGLPLVDDCAVFLAGS